MDSMDFWIVNYLDCDAELCCILCISFVNILKIEFCMSNSEHRIFISYREFCIRTFNETTDRMEVQFPIDAKNSCTVSFSSTNKVSLESMILQYFVTFSIVRLNIFGITLEIHKLRL